MPTQSVVGTDGVAPVYQPDARFTIWALAQLYQGGAGTGKYVGNVGDLVWDIDTNEYYKITAVDVTTLVPTLVLVPAAVPDDQFSDIDVLLGVGPGTPSDTYRIYLDKNVIPYALSVDERLFFYGSAAVSVKIFKGSMTDNPTCISALYDQNGTLLSQSIPLELAATINGQNYAVKAVPQCATTQDMADGEVVTVVAYSNAGNVVSLRQCLIMNTAFISGASVGTKYITSIGLQSPFLSNTDPSLIQYPINVPLSGFSLMGVVNYSDGSSLKLPVDGTKFQLFGLNNGFTATIVGQSIPLVLRYNLSGGEIILGQTVTGQRYITAGFQAITIDRDGSYSVKLFGYPVWIDGVNGYRMQWYLYNMDRDEYYDATPYVRFNANTPAFNPTGYGILQQLSVSVNLNDINGAYKSYIHTQTIGITLLAQGTERNTTNWTIAFTSSQTPQYGINLHAVTVFTNQNLSTVNVSGGLPDQATWLQQVFLNTQPLTDPAVEPAVPTPTHFSLLVGSTWIDYPLSQWNATITLNSVLTDSSTLFIRFFARMPDTDLQLAIAGMPVWQSN